VVTVRQLVGEALPLALGLTATPHCPAERIVAGCGGVGGTTMATINELLKGKVTLEVESLDRIYLNGYVPTLQVGGQVVSFMTGHLGYPIPSPAIFEQIGTRFRGAVRRFAETRRIPLVSFSKGERKIDRMLPLLRAAEKAGSNGVVAIGVAQEFQNVFSANQRKTPTGAPWFSFSKADRRVTCYYFYILDAEFGPCFLKICAYFPYPVKLWCNGHEWAKRQAAKQGIAFTPLSNGFASCDDPVALQALCDRLGAVDIRALFERWMCQIPRPLTDRDRAAGFWWDLSMRQIEVSRTLIFSFPRHARAFFEAMVRDNLGLGRPHEVELIFSGRPTRRGRPRCRYPETFKTKVVTEGVEIRVNVFYKDSRIKQYLKDGRGLRIETVANSPGDFGVLRRLEHLPELVAKARDANRRILEVQSAGQGCAIGPALFERIQQPYVRGGQRTGALRFGDPRVIALAGALCLTLHAVAGFTNRSLRALVAGLLGIPYGARQMTYDLRRLRLHGLIQRVHGHRYWLTPDGQRFALFYAKLANRVFPPLFAAPQPNSPPKLQRALADINQCVDDALRRAGLPPAA
jgi:hypothetical protein